MTQDVMLQNNPTAETYEKAVETFRGGSTILATSQNRVVKALAAGEQILGLIQKNNNELTPELDKMCNDYIAACNKAKTDIEGARKPITQMMDGIKGLFTTEEKKIDSKQADTIPAKLQVYRNNYAKKIAEEQEKQRKEAERIKAIEQEKVTLTSTYESRLAKFFSDFLFIQKNKLQSEFNNVTVENADGIKASMMAYAFEYKYDHFATFQHGLFSMLIQKDDIQALIEPVAGDQFKKFCGEYTAQLSELRQSLLDRFPSKIIELQQLAQANAEEKQRLEREREQREAEEKRKLEEEEQQRLAQQQQNISANQVAGQTMAMFNAEASVTSVAAPETRNGFEMVIQHPAAWALIYQLWFEHEGRTLSNAEIEKKSMGQMKKFCEGLAHKQNIKIDNNLITYQPTYKAVNRKS